VPFHKISPLDGSAGGGGDNAHAHAAVEKGGAVRSSSTPSTNPQLAALVQERRREAHKAHKRPQPSGVDRTSFRAGGSAGKEAVSGRAEDFTRVFQRTFLEMFLVK